VRRCSGVADVAAVADVAVADIAVAAAGIALPDCLA